MESELGNGSIFLFMKAKENLLRICDCRVSLDLNIKRYWLQSFFVPKNAGKCQEASEGCPTRSG